jgi:hypothetical protein
LVELLLGSENLQHLESSNSGHFQM